MNVDKAWEHFNIHSGKASDGTRQLAFAGIAVIWLFKTGEATASVLPPQLVLCLAAFSLSLLLDLLQYLAGTVIWGSFAHKKEGEFNQQGISLDSEFDDPGKVINRPIFALFWAKVVVLILGQIGLVAYLLRLWKIVA